MKRLSKLTLLTIPAVLLTSCSLFAPSVETVEKNLRNANYEVTVTSGDDIDTDDSNTPLFNLMFVSDCVYGEKEKDVIWLIYFYSNDDASDAYDFMHSDYTMGLINELVYVGTSQAIKDAGIKTIFD